MQRCPRFFTLLFLFALLFISPIIMAGPVKHRSKPMRPFTASTNYIFKTSASVLYDSLRLQEFGLTEKAFKYALKGYKNLLEQGKLKTTGVMSICDFSQSSRHKRLYIINLDEMIVSMNTYVAHGRRSGGEFAYSFSNNPNSHKSSLGFYITGQTYQGQHGLSLRINGLERGINDRALARNIVVHGSVYTGEEFLESNGVCGRSFGCPAVPSTQIDEVINTIKEGTCLFIYYPSTQYLKKSKILNG